MPIDKNFEGNPDVIFNEKFSSVSLLRKGSNIFVLGNPTIIKKNNSRFMRFKESDRLDVSFSL